MISGIKISLADPHDSDDSDDSDSDEAVEKEPRKQSGCNAGLEIQCTSKIDGVVICAQVRDGDIECVDAADEVNCESCADETQFRCLDGECIGRLGLRNLQNF